MENKFDNTLDNYISLFLPEIEIKLKSEMQEINQENLHLISMLNYHMGWEGEEVGNESGGKRIRPLLVLLSTITTGGDWKEALPAAVSIELIHNFSLIHDDIEDESNLRRGRETLWSKWGIAHAINTGDLLFALAQNAIFKSKDYLTPETINDSIELLLDTCIKLTEGQFVDLYFEDSINITVEQYLSMISGKTAALLSCATEIGAVIAGAGKETRNSMKQFGYSLGLAYQVIDDILGIWGDEEITGKPIASDLIQKKKTLPVVHALNKSDDLKKIWLENEIYSENLDELISRIENTGAKEYAQLTAKTYSDSALDALDKACKNKPGCSALLELTNRLLFRNR